MAAKKQTKAKPVSTKADSSEIQSKEDKPMVVKQSSGKGFGIFACLLSMLALGAVAYTWYETEVRQVKSNADVAIGVTEIGGEISRLADNIVRLESGQSELNNQVQPALETQKALVKSVDKINQNLQKGVNQYLLDQVQQLMIMANNHLILSNNAKMAVAALQQADVLLDTLSSPKFVPVRQKLADEMVALQNISMPDMTGLSAQLMSISKQVPSLPLQNEPSVTPYTDVVDEQVIEQEYTWKTELRQMFSDILNSVQVQRVSQPPKPLLMPEQRYFLNQNIQLELSTAEYGLLKGQQEIFVNNIESAQNWLQEYFDLGNSRVTKIIADLESLKQTELNPKLPDISGSYNALNEAKGSE